MCKIKKSFTLIELLIVILILSISSYLIISNFKVSQNTLIFPDGLRQYFYPKGFLYITDDNKIISSKHINIKITNPVVYDYNMQQILFEDYKNQKIIFKYILNKGIQNSYILQCKEGIYVFKPLHIIKVANLQQAKKILMGSNILPKEGNYYK